MSSRQPAAGGWRASAVSGEDHRPSGQCFMAPDGQIYWQPTPQRSAAPRGYSHGPGPRFSGYEQQYSPYKEYSPSVESQRASKSRQIPQAGPLDSGPACDSRYIERPGAPSVATPPRMRASLPVLREVEESAVGPEPKLPIATPSESERRKEAPDSRQGAAKITDAAHGAQQPTAAAEPRERKPSVLLFLACSVAFIAIALAVILVYTFGTPATARRLRSPRFCGDVPSWRTNRLKNDFMKCSEESCSRIACGPINDTWCLAGAPPFDSKCECCDWCVVRELVCGKRARVSSGSNPYASCQASCGRL